MKESGTKQNGNVGKAANPELDSAHSGTIDRCCENSEVEDSIVVIELYRGSGVNIDISHDQNVPLSPIMVG